MMLQVKNYYLVRRAPVPEGNGGLMRDPIDFSGGGDRDVPNSINSSVSPGLTRRAINYIRGLMQSLSKGRCCELLPLRKKRLRMRGVRAYFKGFLKNNDL